MKASQAVFIHSAELENYTYPPECPFRAERAGMTRARLESMGLLEGSGRRLVPPAGPADRSTLERFHTPRYLDALIRAPKGELTVDGLAMGLGSPDNPVFRGMYEYAALACGATLTAADLLLAGEADAAFNPSGGYHHACRQRAMGFCYLNDIVFGCLRLTDAGKRVLFLDIDAHFCNGVQEAFEERSDVMTVSFHESGRTLFPGTGFESDIGTGPGRGYSVNVPLPMGTYDAAYLRAFRAIAPPLVEAYDPDVIVLEIGMDTLAGDPLTHMGLTNNVHAEIVEFALACGRPLLVTGGGGYHVENTVRGWSLVWSVLIGGDEAGDDMTLGLGGVMLETTDWSGGLRDRRLAPDASLRARVDAEVDRAVEKVKANVFGIHGL